MSDDEQLREAATKFANEVSGCWSAYEPELRGVMGHTNFNCVVGRLADLRAALSHTKGEL